MLDCSEDLANVLAHYSEAKQLDATNKVDRQRRRSPSWHCIPDEKCAPRHIPTHDEAEHKEDYSNGGNDAKRDNAKGGDAVYRELKHLPQ
jgi:hypothetical protein